MENINAKLDPSRVQVFKKVISDKEKLDRSMSKSTSANRIRPRNLRNNTLLQIESESKIEAGDPKNITLSTVFLPKTAATIKQVGTNESKFEENNAVQETLNSQYGDHKEFESFISKTMNVKKFKENAASVQMIQDRQFQYKKSQLPSYYNKNESQISSGNYQSRSLTPDFLRKKQSLRNSLSQNDFYNHFTRNSIKITSNNIIQAPLLISSDDFKIRKLNPNKLYKALQSYYQQTFEQDQSFEDSKHAGYLFNKDDLVQLIKSKDANKIQSLLRQRNQGYQDRLKKWRDYREQQQKEMNKSQDFSNADLGFLNDMKFLETLNASGDEIQYKDIEKFRIKLNQINFEGYGDKNVGTKNEHEVITEENSMLLVQDEGIQCEPSRTSVRQKSSEMRKSIGSFHDFLQKSYMDKAIELGSLTERTQKLQAGLIVKGFNPSNAKSSLNLNQSENGFNSTFKLTNIQTSRESTKQNPIRERIQISTVTPTIYDQISDDQSSQYYQQQRQQHFSQMYLPDLKPQITDMAMSQQSHKNYLNGSQSNNNIKKLNFQLLNEQINIGLDHAKIGDFLQSRSILVKDETSKAGQTSFLNVKIKQQPDAPTYGQLLTERQLKSNQLIRRDGVLVTKDELNQKRKQVISKHQNQSLNSTQQLQSQSQTNMQRLKSAAMMVNKTMRKDIYDPIVMRRDFNNVQLIGNQRQLTMGQSNRKLPGFIYPLINNE
ncbi:UNKNOWN [Stylonychia lemnae]|uniref:Uncharacterized protein n=1 Tax=Stylonychia lemnae TaxID=5949 RepID=A0A078ASQ5_STYLE|nr:UNKNOWN [Stylonychia lemnae]|eukprot:CDW85041.1 UNKNOWN [Stylonychia lemnae]